jgi:hypothetical protein
LGVVLGFPKGPGPNVLLLQVQLHQDTQLLGAPLNQTPQPEVNNITGHMISTDWCACSARRFHKHIIGGSPSSDRASWMSALEGAQLQKEAWAGTIDASRQALESDWLKQEQPKPHSKISLTSNSPDSTNAITSQTSLFIADTHRRHRNFYQQSTCFCCTNMLNGGLQQMQKQC